MEQDSFDIYVCPTCELPASIVEVVRTGSMFDISILVCVDNHKTQIESSMLKSAVVDQK